MVENELYMVKKLHYRQKTALRRDLVRPQQLRHWPSQQHLFLELVLILLADFVFCRSNWFASKLKFIGYFITTTDANFLYYK